MVEGMEKEQFLNSGCLSYGQWLQSAQYRLIEISCTDMINLVNAAERPALTRYATSTSRSKNYPGEAALRNGPGKEDIDVQHLRKIPTTFKAMGMRYRDKNSENVP